VWWRERGKERRRERGGGGERVRDTEGERERGKEAKIGVLEPCSETSMCVIMYVGGCNSLQHSAILQHAETHCNKPVPKPLLRDIMYCNTLQRTATHCNTQK